MTHHSPLGAPLAGALVSSIQKWDQQSEYSTTLLKIHVLKLSVICCQYIILCDIN